MTPPPSAPTGTFGPMERDLRALAVGIVPEIARLDDAGWRAVATVVEEALASRPAPLRRKLLLFVRVLGWISVARYAARPASLDAVRLGRLLASVERSRLLLLRRGFWGLRTLVFMGYWTRPESAAAIGYRARPEGWEARR
ncbi:MAG TPA: hypothetical protein VF139_02950 [Candidatus Polarisedimenticolaceae bacterium]